MDQTHDTHPVLRATAAIGEALKSVADTSPVFMTTPDKATALIELATISARIDELRLRILSEADDVAASSGCRDAAAWLAHHTRGRPEDSRADARLATALARRPTLAAGLRTGSITTTQARVVAGALGRLPADVPVEVVARAEEHLVDLASEFAPTPLARLGRHILHVVAPELADRADARALAALEDDAHRQTRLSLRRLGDGTTRLSGRIPDEAGARLATYLEAFANPRQHPGGPGAPTAWGSAEPAGQDQRLPYPRRLGQAFQRLLETLDPNRLPIHGGSATTVVITVDLDTLRRDVGTATLLTDSVPGPADGDSTGGGLSAGAVRRLACSAGIIPAVLGGSSEILDLGRIRRLFSRAQRLAMLVRDRTCRAEGCDIPGVWCEAHHWDPWSRGGSTDLADGVLLCSHHHHRAHDDRYDACRMPHGGVRFHRRC